LSRWPKSVTLALRSSPILAAAATCFVVLYISIMTHAQTAQTKEQTTRATVDAFNEAFNRHDADALVPLLTEDTVFEDTSPAPDGRRIEGKAAVVEHWRG
jgi:hypothetical protein